MVIISFFPYFSNNYYGFGSGGYWSDWAYDPWNGYKPVPFSLPGKPQWQLIPIGPAGVPRIELPEGAFMGVWDASNVYDIVRLTEKEMIVRTPFLKGGGWFELYFEAR